MAVKLLLQTIRRNFTYIKINSYICGRFDYDHEFTKDITSVGNDLGCCHGL